ncbi:MAG TPA: hypothetical protein VLH16_05485, partial [Bacteroidales bacterium]|nr:hypothetical protein [Bacteroidales bacterium]
GIFGGELGFDYRCDMPNGIFGGVPGFGYRCDMPTAFLVVSLGLITDVICLRHFWWCSLV